MLYARGKFDGRLRHAIVTSLVKCASRSDFFALDPLADPRRSKPSFPPPLVFDDGPVWEPPAAVKALGSLAGRFHAQLPASVGHSRRQPQSLLF
jgi:hypothetical protein